MNTLVGQSIGQYELRKLVGVGGMGAVYLAFQSNLDREVAIKILTPKEGLEEIYLKRFAVEARTAAALEHSHIVPVYDYGSHDTYSYIVMRLLSGGSLEMKMAPGKIPLTVAEVVQVVGDIASALQYAHDKGIVHRDIKPSNIMFDDRGTLFMVDFGIAKLAYATTGLTETNQQIGTPRYMAPEQWRGDTIGPAADQYSLAILTYQMLTGQALFKAEASHEYMHRHLYDMPPLTENWQTNLPESIIPVLARALRKHPNSRYPDIETFAADLQAATNDDMPAAAQVMPAEKRSGPTPNDTLILSEQPALFAPTTLEANKTIIQQKLWQWGGVAAGVALILGLVLGLVWLSGQSSTSDITSTPAGGGNGGAASGSVTAPAAILVETEEVTSTLTSTSAPTETTQPTETDPPSATATRTETPTVTDTLTHTASPTETPTITSSDTPTSTQTAALTPTATPSPTLTNTRRPTQTPTEAVTAATAAVATASACEVADLNDNGEVDIFDLRAISAIFGAVQGDDEYNESYDFDNNAIINVLDLRRVSSQYGMSC